MEEVVEVVPTPATDESEQSPVRKPSIALHAAQAAPGHHVLVRTTYSSPTYCNLCEQLLWGLTNQGLECIHCRFVCHEGSCEVAAAKMPTCRDFFYADARACSSHHWVRGNVRGAPKCMVCTKRSGMVTSGVALGRSQRCSSCRAHCHEECLPVVSKTCTGGSLGPFLVLPHTVTTNGLSVMPSGIEGAAPLLFFINTRSGATQGEQVFRGLAQYVNRVQLHDLDLEKGPAQGLNMFRDLFPRVKIVACGGDGTFGWVQSAIDAMGLDPQLRPPVAHFPLGTGNDMARSQGWGAGYAGESIKKVMRKFAASDIGQLDRWLVTFDGQPHGYTPAMNNYFDVGIIAQVAHRFHTSREAAPEKFANRTVNKLKYAFWGATSSLKGLAEVVKLYCDGAEVELPSDIQALTVLNLPNYAAGQRLWNSSETEKFGKNFFSDGLLEVVSLKSATDVGLAKVGIKPTRLAQCKHIRIELSDKMPCQMDGEPWIQDPCTIDISLLNTVPVLVTHQVARREATRSRSKSMGGDELADIVTPPLDADSDSD